MTGGGRTDRRRDRDEAHGSARDAARDEARDGADEAGAGDKAGAEGALRRRKVPRAASVAGIAAAVTALALGLTLLATSPHPVDETARPAPPTGAESPAPGQVFAKPAGWEPLRPAFHLTPEQHWINDPQRPVYADGQWHLYYLYNADYPHGNGTEWYHATSDDMLSWRNRGVAIEKYRNGLGDILTGSAVVDEHDTAGFGAGAIVALTTQQSDGVQRQSLFFSTDGGETFSGYEGNPVMDNPGVTDWRDPKVVWDDANDQWVMVLAEGRRLGFYTSTNLREWTYASDFVRDDHGLLECPDLFEMVDPVSGRRTWVLGASADAASQGGTTGFAYWTGSWDGTGFTADEVEPQWLDGGADFYAAVTWDDPRESDSARLERRYALGWINNWAYATDLPGGKWQGGSLSTTRELTLREVDGRLTLLSRPASALAHREGDTVAAGDTPTTLEPGSTVALPVQPSTGSYRLRVEIAAPEGGEVRLRLGDDAAGAVTVGYDADRGQIFLDRREDAAAEAMPEPYRAVRTADTTARGTVVLDVLVDYSSVEVFTGDGSASLTSAAFVRPGATITAESVGAAATLDRIELGALAVWDPNTPDGRPGPRS